ncbi:MAG: lysoplasmalogenase family protein [Candidatus Thorarchaeota archaeon]
MSNRFLNTQIDYLRVLVVIAILGLEAIAAITGIANPWFLSASIAIVILALVNYIDVRSQDWSRYALLFLIAMICGSIGDFMMAGIFYITPIAVLNGIILFGIGHVFYLLGLRDRSSLLLRPRDTGQPRLIAKNLVTWLVVCVLIILLFVFTVFNPAMLELGFGMLGYGLLLGTVLAFAVTKWNDEFPTSIKFCLSIGFILFLFSDWLIGYHLLTDPTFLSGPYVGLTYIVGQLLIQLSTMFGSKGI